MANALSKVKTKKKKRKPVSNVKKTENSFNGIVSLIDVSESNNNAHLLLTKPPIHQPEAGLNPLVDAAAYVFLLMGQLTRTRSHQELEKLQTSLLAEVRNFQNSIYLSNYTPEILAEYVPISSYILCTMLDDVLASTTFGNEGKWKEFSLLHAHELELLSRENFLVILERFIQDPNNYIDIMEFTYICLTLGFKYGCHSSGFDAEQLQKILHSLYKRIRAFRGNISRQLSPYPLKYVAPPYHVETWQSRFNQTLARLLKKAPHSSTFLTTCPTLMENILNVENRFQKAMQFLNSKMIQVKGEKIKLNALPWQLFIGSPDAGKTTWLTNSSVKFIANNKSDDTGDNWHWWVTAESVVIDIGSNYLAVKNTDKTLVNKPWHFLLDLILQERSAKGLKAVTLFISYAEIMDNAHQHRLIENFSQRIEDLHARFGRDLTFNLVVTKCDLIPGFMPFFADFTQEELYQAWGARLPQPSHDHSLTDLLNSRFNMLIKRLNQQLIYRLNQEKDFNFQSKISIQGFPLQMEHLKKELMEIVKGLVNRNPHFALKGFYLTSASQEKEKDEVNNLPQVISGDKFLQSLSIMKTPMVAEQSYFIKQLLLYGLLTETHATRLANHEKPVIHLQKLQ